MRPTLKLKKNMIRCMELLRKMKKKSKKRNTTKSTAKKMPVFVINVIFGGKKCSERKMMEQNQLMKISYEQTFLAESSFSSYVKEGLLSW